jgi:hypothetical protein
MNDSEQGKNNNKGSKYAPGIIWFYEKKLGGISPAKSENDTEIYNKITKNVKKSAKISQLSITRNGAINSIKLSIDNSIIAPRKYCSIPIIRIANKPKIKPAIEFSL